MRDQILLWSLLPTLAFLVFAAYFSFRAYSRVTEALVEDRNSELSRLLAGQMSLELGEYADKLADLRDAHAASGGAVPWATVLAEFERETIKDRVRAGMAAARRSGVHCGRRPTLKAEHVADARVRLAAGQTARSVARFLRVSEATLYRALARHPAPVASPPAA